VLDCWLSRTRDLAAAEAFFRRTISSTGCTPEHVVTDKATCYPSVIRTCAPDAKHTATGFYNPVLSTNRCERNHGYVKSRIRPMRGLKSFACATRLFPALDVLQLLERGFVEVPSVGAPCTGGRSYVRARHITSIITRLGHTLRTAEPRRPPPSLRLTALIPGQRRRTLEPVLDLLRRAGRLHD
jgi:hypothetical protein